MKKICLSVVVLLLTLSVFGQNNPKIAKQSALVALSYINIGDYAKALPYMNEAIELDSANSFYIALRGNIKLRQGDFSGAWQDFNHGH